ncbi:MAG: LPS export ABC transporter periplasmic protein LptC [Rickettsiales bacterium]|nr:LPS export ABC transporter periplasmic protein LptC [Rickettsiales bacterium]
MAERPTKQASSQGWVNREADKLLASIGKYTQFVFFSKMSLLGLALLLILTIIILPVINADKEGLRIAFNNAKEKAESVPMMTNPKFQGVDENNQPYTITANSALQHDAQTIVLDKIQADIFLKDDAWMNLSANDGTLNTTNKSLLLKGNVHIFHDAGYEFVTEEMHVDMDQNKAYGDKDVQGKGPMGVLRATGFSVTDRGQVMQFNGRVHLTVYPNAGDEKNDA